MKHVLLLAAFDSQLKWCARVRTAFQDAGYACRVVVPEGRSALSPGQIADAGFSAVERLPWEELVSEALAVDVVVSALAGPLTKRLSIDIAHRVGRTTDVRTPVLVAGWVGVIIEKIIAGYLDRCGLDVIAVNSEQDLRVFGDAAGRLKLPAGNLLLTGLPFLSGRAPQRREGPIRRVLFADQPTVPARRSERTYLYARLVDYARRHPEREVWLKPRHRPDEDTFHRMKFHPEVVLDGWELPPNFRIDYTPISDSLPQVDLLLTVSSTACLEAIDHGCRVALVLDLGVHERHGNHVFLDSGLLATFAQIARDEIAVPEPDWAEGYFFARRVGAAEAIVSRVEQLLATGERPSRAVWATDYFGSAMDLQHELSDVQPSPASPLRSRVRRYGRVLGTAAHVGAQVMPTRCRRTVRRVLAR